MNIILYHIVSIVDMLNLPNCWHDNKMIGGTPEVRSDKSLTLMTFNIRHSNNGPMDQRTNGPMDQWTNGLMDQWTNGPMD